MEELLPDVLKRHNRAWARVFDRVTHLDGVPDGYRAMNDRESIKVEPLLSVRTRKVRLCGRHRADAAGSSGGSNW